MGRDARGPASAVGATAGNVTDDPMYGAALRGRVEAARHSREGPSYCATVPGAEAPGVIQGAPRGFRATSALTQLLEILVDGSAKLYIVFTGAFAAPAHLYSILTQSSALIGTATSRYAARVSP